MKDQLQLQQEMMEQQRLAEIEHQQRMKALEQ
jgi:hypothetical protein